jgi:hypothetical protein
MGTKKTTLQGQPKARPFDEVSPEVQALVMKAAKKREAFVWAQVKGLLQAEKKLTRTQVRDYRAMMLGFFQRAAVLIFDTRAEGAADWDTWLRFVQQAATEAGLKLDGVEV